MPVCSGDLVRRPDVGVAQAVYLVFIRVEPANTGDPNVEIVGAKLNAVSAERVAKAYPGSWIEKVQASKP